MQDLLNTLETFLDSGVNELLSDKPQNLTKPTQIKNNSAISNINGNSNQIENNYKKNLVEELKPTHNIIQNSRNLADSAKSLEELKETIKNFTGCSLHKTAKQAVFSDGNPNSQIMLVGEAPGASEDEQGIPFCGVSGKLLDEIFRSINHSRTENLYITNSVFWRPPGNRRPTDEEIMICRPFVEKHISLIKPKIIILVGSTALTSLLPNATETITKIRGKFFKYNNQYLDSEINITAIFHPSYLLRQPFKKKLMWQDIVKINSFISNK